jgi:hypothetical protein
MISPTTPHLSQRFVSGDGSWSSSGASGTSPVPGLSSLPSAAVSLSSLHLPHHPDEHRRSVRSSSQSISNSPKPYPTVRTPGARN